MKKISKLLLLVVLITTTLLTSCNYSKKGNWTKDDRTRFYKEVTGVIDNNENLDETTKAKWVDLYFEKCQNQYSSFADADADVEGCKRIAVACNEEIFANGSVKGNWSKEDVQKFYKDMNSVKELENFGDNKQRWIECYLEKCEAKYSSYAEADSDEPGCTEIATNCSVSIQE